MLFVIFFGSQILPCSYCLYLEEDSRGRPFMSNRLYSVVVLNSVSQGIAGQFSWQRAGVNQSNAGIARNLQLIIILAL